MAAELGFGVVGLGMGKSHCRSVSEAKGAKLVAVCDLDAERVAAMVDQYGCKGYSSYEEMLQDDDVDVVNVAVESGKHALFGIQAADAGKHMIVEKPADITTARIDQLIGAVKDANVKVGCIFQARLNPLNIKIKEAIDSGRMGKLIGAHGHLPWYRKQSYYEGDHGSWKGTWDLDGGGSLMNQGVHTVDLIQWLAGGVDSVMGMFGVFGHDIEAEDQTVALLKFKNGALGTLYTTTCCYPGLDQLITIYGNQGSIMKDASKLLAWKVQGEDEKKEESDMLTVFGSKENKEAGIAADPMAVSANGHTQIIEDLVGAINDDRDPMIGLESARHAVEIITAIFESGRTGREVKVG
ncbi:MAG: Gfo/Idh/MocA family oxidoreductase [Candidatus Latescibacteria bacterium]|jgi:UDP-N-acetyl-2-amino-2-deoxyglucuronate dehydrogenase|nr:Gfo/Idh/MocA family oxidoreductase [Candidatus Latescibacterota bacterium]